MDRAAIKHQLDVQLSLATLALIKQFKNKIIVTIKIFLYWKNSGKVFLRLNALFPSFHREVFFLQNYIL